MAISTSRAKEPANILIDESICTGCGLCIEVCKACSITNKRG